MDYALVAEQVDAADLKSVGRKAVPVRFRPSAPLKKHLSRCFFVSAVIGCFFVAHMAGIKIPLARKSKFYSNSLRSIVF